MIELIEKLQKVAKDLKVLVVEDEEIIRTRLQQYLGRFFKEAVAACDGEDGLKQYREKGPFDIVVSDIRMPNMNGIEMMQVIKEAHPDQHFIIASAHSESDYFLKLIEIGVNHYVVKPINYTQLMEVLLKLCGQLKMEEELSMYKYNLEELVTEQTRELREQLWTDATTKLPNRIKLKEDLKPKKSQTLAVLNIDNFAKFNTTFGSQFGDEVLKGVSDVLRGLLDEAFFLYRYASDEFVIRAEKTDQEALHRTLLTLMDAFSQTVIEVSGVKLHITFTAGIAACRDKHCVEHARNAVEAVRKVGKGRIAFYDESMDYEAKKKEMLLWVDEVALALSEKRFIPYFQQIIDNTTRKIVKYECLARVQLADGSVVSPARFLPAVEEAGFLPEMGRQIIEKSLAVMAGNSYEFSINITGHELMDRELVGFLESRLNFYGIDPKRVIIEVLEEVSLHEADIIVEQLNRIKTLGCRLAIDDFGTEGSNFSRLMDLSVDIIKIDGSFIKRLDSDEKSRQITRAIVAFAKSIGCQTVAEFVHSEAIWHEVQGIGIDFSQGYWISEPKAVIDGQ